MRFCSARRRCVFMRSSDTGPASDAGAGPGPGRGAAGYPHRQYKLDWLKEALPGTEFRDVTSVLAAMRQIKSASEIALIQKSAELSMDAHLEAMRMMRPGIWEYEVASKMEHVHKSGGCEGEAYAARLRAAGIPITTVRYDGITHDFMMLNPLSGTQATRAAIAQAISILRKALHDA